MKTLFQYNWQVRNDWFSWCENVPEDELLKTRIGGVGSILETLFHIVDVEYSWICDLQGKPPFVEPFASYASLEKVKTLSIQLHQEVKPFVMAWTDEMESRILTDTNRDGEIETFRHGEVMRHIIAHEIHHIGQISVWAREIGQQPITANLIRRGLYN